jgi:hypothetical protein
VEQLDIIQYTGIKTAGKDVVSELNPNVRFEVDGIRSTYDVGNNASMDAMLKASRRAATYHGTGSGPGQAPPTVSQVSSGLPNNLSQISVSHIFSLHNTKASKSFLRPPGLEGTLEYAAMLYM